MCGWRKSALVYAKELVKLKPCAKDPDCVCQYGGRVVSLLRDRNASAADAYYKRRLAKKCPYKSTWQMPTPPSGYVADLKAQPFWDPDEFALGRLLRRKRATLLRELRPFARRRSTLWRDDDSVAYELIESGSWRQLTIFQTRTAWNSTVCAHLPTTCGILQGFARSREGKIELGGKIKLFELGKGASLIPHFGPTNARLFVHFAVTIPQTGDSWLRVGQEARKWLRPGEMHIFDDSFEHEVRNEGTMGPRVVLGMELIHPELQRR